MVVIETQEANNTFLNRPNKQMRTEVLDTDLIRISNIVFMDWPKHPW